MDPPRIQPRRSRSRVQFSDARMVKRHDVPRTTSLGPRDPTTGFDPPIDISRTERYRYRYLDRGGARSVLGGTRGGSRSGTVWPIVRVRFLRDVHVFTCTSHQFATRARAHTTMGTAQSGAMRTTWPPNHVDGKNVKMATFAGGCVRRAERRERMRMPSNRQWCGRCTNEHVLTSNDRGHSPGASGDSSWRTNGNQACCRRAWDTPKDTSNDRRIDKCAAEGQDTPKLCN